MPWEYYTPELDNAYSNFRISGAVYTNFCLKEYVRFMSFSICYDSFGIGFEVVSFWNSSSVKIENSPFYFTYSFAYSTPSSILS